MEMNKPIEVNPYLTTSEASKRVKRLLDNSEMFLVLPTSDKKVGFRLFGKKGEMLLGEDISFYVKYTINPKNGNFIVLYVGVGYMYHRQRRWMEETHHSHNVKETDGHSGAKLCRSRIPIEKLPTYIQFVKLSDIWFMKYHDPENVELDLIKLYQPMFNSETEGNFVYDCVKNKLNVYHRNDPTRFIFTDNVKNSPANRNALDFSECTKKNLNVRKKRNGNHDITKFCIE